MRPRDELRREKLRASWRVLRSDLAERAAAPLPPIDAPRPRAVATRRPTADEAPPAVQRILASAALAAALLTAVSALSEAAANAMYTMEPRVASLESGRSHFGFGQ